MTEKSVGDFRKDNTFSSHFLLSPSLSETIGMHLESDISSSLRTCDVTQNVNAHVINTFGLRRFHLRREREFTPNSKKDQEYWEKRHRNNAAAQKSRIKRRIQDSVLETRVNELIKDNCRLRNEVFAWKRKFGIPENQVVTLGDHENGAFYSKEQCSANASNQTKYTSFTSYNDNAISKRRKESHTLLKKWKSKESGTIQNHESANCFSKELQNLSNSTYITTPRPFDSSLKTTDEDNLLPDSTSREDEEVQYEYVF